MTAKIAGVHHVTAIAIDPQSNIDFYTRVLGLRLVKKTVNFDAPDTYHFYYGDHSGRPGTILTFFPFVLADRGRSGSGMVDTTTFAVPPASLENWMARLTEHAIDFDGPFERFSRQVIGFRDPDGLKLELVGLGERETGGQKTGGDADAIRGFEGVALCVEAPERTARLLTDTFGYDQVAQEDGRIRFRAASQQEDAVGGVIDIYCVIRKQRRASPAAGRFIT